MLLFVQYMCKKINPFLSNFSSLHITLQVSEVCIPTSEAKSYSTFVN